MPTSMPLDLNAITSKMAELPSFILGFIKKFVMEEGGTTNNWILPTRTSEVLIMVLAAPPRESHSRFCSERQVSLKAWQEHVIRKMASGGVAIPMEMTLRTNFG